MLSDPGVCDVLLAILSQCSNSRALSAETPSTSDWNHSGDLFHYSVAHSSADESPERSMCDVEHDGCVVPFDLHLFRRGDPSDQSDDRLQSVGLPKPSTDHTSCPTEERRRCGESAIATSRSTLESDAIRSDSCLHALHLLVSDSNGVQCRGVDHRRRTEIRRTSSDRELRSLPHLGFSAQFLQCRLVLRLSHFPDLSQGTPTSFSSSTCPDASAESRINLERSSCLGVVCRCRVKLSRCCFFFFFFSRRRSFILFLNTKKEEISFGVQTNQ